MPEDPHGRYFLLAGALAGYALMMATNPARHSLRDGLRCVRRYRQIWLLPAGFALVHSAFRLWRRAYETWVGACEGRVLIPWTGWQPPPWRETLAASWLPAAESTAALFNCIITTFPLSAVVAALFLVNWRGYQSSLYRALRQRFGPMIGVSIYAGLICCASAGVVKPVLFGGLPSLNNYYGAEALMRAGEGVDSLSFLFEYALGVGVQIYIILLCFAWIRGLTFDFEDLRRFALRRFAFVVKWTAVVMLLSILGITVPLTISSFQIAPDPHDTVWTSTVILAARWLLSAILLLFCSMQILLIFHNEALRQALGDHWRLLRFHGWHIGWFVLIIALHFFGLAFADAYLPLALGSWTWPGATWSLLMHPLLWTALAGWFLASWVCMFRRCERNVPDVKELVRY